MNTKIIASIAAMAVVAAASIGGTIAYFTSTASFTGATFTSANMALKVDSDPSPSNQVWVDTFAVPTTPFASVKPGSAGAQILDIKNEGGVDGSVNIRFEQTAWSSLGDNLVFTVYYDEENNGFADDTTPIATGTVGQYLGNTYPLGNIGAGQIASVKIAWNVPTTAGNDIMGKSITLNTIFDLTQAQ